MLMAVFSHRLIPLAPLLLALLLFFKMAPAAPGHHCLTSVDADDDTEALPRNPIQNDDKVGTDVSDETDSVDAAIVTVNATSVNILPEQPQSPLNVAWQWSDNRLDAQTAGTDLTVSWDGLCIMKAKGSSDQQWTNVRAQRPFTAKPSSSTTLSVYYEVLVKEVVIKDKGSLHIGWTGPAAPVSAPKPSVVSQQKNGMFGQDENEESGPSFSSSSSSSTSTPSTTPTILCIDENGTLNMESGRHVPGYATGFGIGDVVGAGLLVSPAGHRKLFFTKNGQLQGNPTLLSSNSGQTDFFPIMEFDGQSTANLELNFGGNNPFKFDVAKNMAQLIGSA